MLQGRHAHTNGNRGLSPHSPCRGTGVGMLSPQAQVIIIEAERETKPSSIPDLSLTPESHSAPRQVSSPLSVEPLASRTAHKAQQAAGLGSHLDIRQLRFEINAEGALEDKGRPLPPITHQPRLEAKSTVPDGKEHHHSRLITRHPRLATSAVAAQGNRVNIHSRTHIIHGLQAHLRRLMGKSVTERCRNCLSQRIC